MRAHRMPRSSSGDKAEMANSIKLISSKHKTRQTIKYNVFDWLIIGL